MTDQITADKLVKVYIKIRDHKEALEAAHKIEVAQLNEQLHTIEQELLEMCKATGQDGGKTPHGTFTRTVKERYTTNDWPSLYSVILTHNAPELLEQRIHQGNFKKFLAEHPEALPAGVNLDRRYAITVYRPRNPTN